MWLDKLKEMKRQSGKTSKEIAEITGIPKSTIDKLFAGQTKEPFLSSVRSIVHCLGYTLDDLTEEPNIETTIKDKKILNKYYSLDSYGKEAVDKILDIEYRRCESLRNDNLILTTIVARSENNETKTHKELSKFESDSDNIEL